MTLKVVVTVQPVMPNVCTEKCSSLNCTIAWFKKNSRVFCVYKVQLLACETVHDVLNEFFTLKNKVIQEL